MENNRNVVNKTCNGKCSRCGDCCSLIVPFTRKELEVIKKYVKENNIKPIERFTDTTFNANCCFYDSINHKCLIYEVRPFVCRDFICSRKNWKIKRDLYDKRADYNSVTNLKSKLASFDDLIYNDYAPIFQYLFGTVQEYVKKGLDEKDLVKILKRWNRLDLLNYITCEDENGNKINGKEILSNL